MGLNLGQNCEYPTLPSELNPRFLYLVPAKCRDLLATRVTVRLRPNTARGQARSSGIGLCKTGPSHTMPASDRQP